MKVGDKDLDLRPAVTKKPEWEKASRSPLVSPLWKLVQPGPRSELPTTFGSPGGISPGPSPQIDGGCVFKDDVFRLYASSEPAIVEYVGVLAVRFA